MKRHYPDNRIRMASVLRLSVSFPIGCVLVVGGCSGAPPGSSSTAPAAQVSQASNQPGTSPGRRLTNEERDARPRVQSKIASSVRGKRQPHAVRVASVPAGTPSVPAVPTEVPRLQTPVSPLAPVLGDGSLLTPPGETAPAATPGTDRSDAIIINPPPKCVAPYHLADLYPGPAYCDYDSTMNSIPNPWFQVVNIQYSLPGSMSEAEYSQGSYIGSQASYQEVDSIGLDVQVGWPGGSSIEDKFTVGNISGGSSSLQVTSSSGIAITTNMTDDVVHHEKDIFEVWVNPVVQTTTSQRQYSRGTTTNLITKILVTSTSTPRVESVTAGELLGLTPIPSYKALSALTDAQKQQILAMDPFWSSGGFNPASTRYQYETSVELDGPPPGGNFVQSTYDIQTDDSSSTSSGIQTTDEITADFGFDSLFKAGLDLQFQYQAISTSTNGTVADASLKVGSLNECVHVGVDVYKDLSFGTLITVPTWADESGAQSGWDCCNSDHSVCEQGDPLDGSCTANACLQTVCSEDPYCCANWWDDICVGEATACSPQVCGSPL